MSINSAHILLKEIIEKTPNRKKNGYIQVFYEGEWQWLHRVIAKEKIGADIYEKFEVHHIDGDKQNNHPDNLKVLSKKEHQAIHEEQRESKSDVAQNVRNYISERIKKLQAKNEHITGNIPDQKQKAPESAISQNKSERSIELEAILSRMQQRSFSKDFDELDIYDDVCLRCGGTGYLPVYNHVEGGVCFACGGSGKG